MSKILLTSGCSFSECVSTHIDTWPRHLYKALQNAGFNKHISSAMGSQGNGLISRGIIHNVVKALETYKPSEILVGVMWSGSNRHDFYYDQPEMLEFMIDKIHNGWVENPTGFVEDSKKWIILNHHWGADQDGHRNPEAKTYYKHFYDEIGHAIYSLEHILRTQWFLKANNIKYFFTNYTKNNIVYNPKDIEHPEINYLYKQLDFSNYLPVESEFTYLKDNKIFIEDYEKIPNWNNMAFIHPTSRQHEYFVNNVIMNYLKEKNWLNN